MIGPLEKRIGDDLDPLTLEELREDLNLKHLKMNPRAIDVDTEGGEEVGLFAGGFKGRCYNCGKYGHRARDCQDKQKGGRGSNGGRGNIGGRGNGGQN